MQELQTGDSVILFELWSHFVIFQILVLMVPKRIGNSEEINQDFSLAEVNTGNMKEGTCQWLQRDISGPPLILCQMEQVGELKLLFTNHC